MFSILEKSLNWVENSIHYATDLVSTTALLGTADPHSIVKILDAAGYQGQISSTLRSLEVRRFAIGDGTEKFQYTFWGTGAPSTTYDAILALATTLPGSKYCNTTNGYWYTAVTDDAGTVAWMCDVLGGRTAGTDTTLHTGAGQGGVILVADGGAVYIKSEEETTDEAVTIS